MIKKFFLMTMSLALVSLALICSIVLLKGVATFQELFLENKQLKEAVANLASDELVAYLKVISQEIVEGQIVTNVKFTEVLMSGKEETRIVHQYRIRGDVVHVDALVVKFNTQKIQSGEEKAMYLWRRLYDEKTSPEQGFLINIVGEEAPVYAQVFHRLKLQDRRTFWQGIWSLADSPDSLKHLGIQAIYGSVIYQKVSLGKVYEYRFNRQGQIFSIVHEEI